MRWIDKNSSLEASRRRWISKNSGLAASRRRWIDKNSGLAASRRRWIDKNSGLELPGEGVSPSDPEASSRRGALRSLVFYYSYLFRIGVG